ncbi:MAG TPA: porin [Solibacterales bacterium]|nr:porin [Bryobacterales bacterium]
MKHAVCSALVVCLLSVAPESYAQTTGAPPPDPKPILPFGKVDFSGLLDGYYSLNFNHPKSGINQLRNFDIDANSFALNMGKFTMEQAADPLGFRVDVGFGKAFDVFHATELAGGRFMNNIMQAYVSAKAGSKLKLDFGKFYTSAGAEVTETHLNWNYSRALLYANGPYYHFGVRATAPLHKNFTAGVQLLNGWNNIKDNNTGKTIGLTSAVTTSKVTWSNTYLVGPEKTDTNEGYRHFYDTVLLLTPHEKFSAYMNFDYGVDRVVGGQNNEFLGIGFAARMAATKTIAFSPRFEWYSDRQGFITGTAQQIKEFTFTGEKRWNDYFVTRLEFRRDWSNQPFFFRGNDPASAKSQTTLLAGMMVHFGPRR